MTMIRALVASAILLSAWAQPMAHAADGFPWGASLSLRSVFNDQDLGVPEENWNLGKEETVGRFDVWQGARLNGERWSTTAYVGVRGERSTNNLRSWNNFTAPYIGVQFRGPKVFGSHGQTVFSIEAQSRQYVDTPPPYRDPDDRITIRWSISGGGDWIAE